MTMAPTMPQKSAGYWYGLGTWKERKMTAKTKTLSIDSDHSTR